MSSLKATHVGAPRYFALEAACRKVNDAFGSYGCYLVGSSLERPDWRDIDVRFIMPDADFAVLFPDASMTGAQWEFDPRWQLINIGIADQLSRESGLPVDFQIQPQTWANERHAKQRQALGLTISKEKP